MCGGSVWRLRRSSKHGIRRRGDIHNTAEFAVNCLASWWELHGRSIYPQCDRLLILADGGGGNGYNLRSWKKDLQDRLCDGSGLTVTVCHYPLGCSKWN